MKLNVTIARTLPAATTLSAAQADQLHADDNWQIVVDDENSLDE
jgi:hypothetical protein